MTTGKGLFTSQAAAADFAPVGTEETGAVQASADALQFAGLLLGAAAPAGGVRSILFASASDNTPSQQLIYETAQALRLIRGCCVAVVLLSPPSPTSSPLGGMHAFESSLGRDWVGTGDANLAMFSWNHLDDGRSPITASAFSELVRTIQERFDFILVDAGAVGSSAQPILLASHCSATVLLVKPGVTTVAEVRSSQTVLSQAQARLLGFAFVETS
jgi:hypothetical protein